MLFPVHKLSRLIRIGSILLVIIVPALYVGYQYHLGLQMAQCDSLWSSALSGENAGVEQSLHEGVDPNCEEGQPLKSALEGGHQDTAQILRKAGAKDSRLKRRP